MGDQQTVPKAFHLIKTRATCEFYVWVLNWLERSEIRHAEAAERFRAKSRLRAAQAEIVGMWLRAILPRQESVESPPPANMMFKRRTWAI